MRALLLTASLLFVAAPAAAAADCSEVPAALAVMVEIDQGVRSASNGLAALDAAARQRLFDRWELIDRTNTRRLKAIIARCGWPDAKRFGERTAHDAWLLAQHADLDRPFQRRVLALLEREVATGTVPASNFAYLSDRVAVAEGRPQPYGTQLDMREACKLAFKPLLGSREQVEARRQAIGMPTLAEYERQGREHLLPPDCPR